MSGQDVACQGECFIAHDDAARLGDGLQPSRKIGLRANDRIVHSIRASEIADVAISGVDAHPRLERVFDSRRSPFRIEFKKAPLHPPTHPPACLITLPPPLSSGTSKHIPLPPPIECVV